MIASGTWVVCWAVSRRKRQEGMTHGYQTGKETGTISGQLHIM